MRRRIVKEKIKKYEVEIGVGLFVVMSTITLGIFFWKIGAEGTAGFLILTLKAALQGIGIIPPGQLL